MMLSGRVDRTEEDEDKDKKKPEGDDEDSGSEEDRLSLRRVENAQAETQDKFIRYSKYLWSLSLVIPFNIK